MAATRKSRRRKRSAFYEKTVLELKRNPFVKNPWALASKIEKIHKR